ncbi:protein phosphatase [Acetitomaculum ruminis DSM 5522]|uniref:Protein phosphatase n=1 Tax=Acetitomaculum ruminis DSM 5522 TaxID=1120918 RepID=A0A1I0XUM9_9FIRM|nr:Stp1/IreP family PP2C-type Ser/Thr phosphatase [Acetitomaculum ruminis]SFB04367.1 protein phosphatase [Acetitomaculum ruminis DSM 5522]
MWFFAKTDIGKVRKTNQDKVFATDKPIGNLCNLFIVADGMGGHKAGDIASGLAVEQIIKSVGIDESNNPHNIFTNAIKMANSEIVKKSAEDTNYNGMGTTIVLASIKKGRLSVANVGDSRLYIINKSIKQITEDHSLVEEMVKMGEIDKNEARKHPDKNIITRAVGAAKRVLVDYFEIDLEEGDRILMCSDGLTNMVDDEEINHIINSSGEVDEVVDRLIDSANLKGGKDNISVILIKPLEFNEVKAC